jgi:hypothetical protein
LRRYTQFGLKDSTLNSKSPLPRGAYSTTKAVAAASNVSNGTQIAKHSEKLTAPPYQKHLKQAVTVNPISKKKGGYDIKHFSSISLYTSCYSQPMDIEKYTQATTMKDD